MTKKILIIDDDYDICVLLKRFLTKKGFEAEAFHSGHKGIAAYYEQRYDAVICDYRLGDMDAGKVIDALKKKDPGAAIIVITGYSDIKTAVEVIKMGAFDYISKPLVPDEVLSVLQETLKGESTRSAIKPSTATLPGIETTVKAGNDSLPVTGSGYYKGQSAAMQEVYSQVSLVADTPYSVILYGESGTGKEVVARSIHEESSRRGKPFVAIDCGILSRELAASELFGHVKGSFTGAISDKEGHFSLAEGGTLFLDEVGNLPMEVQTILLRVIQERRFKKVGGSKEIDTDVRIIVASNENLYEAHRKGKFREDLYHRFNEFMIHLPPLRDRKGDIMPLAAFFLDKACKETGKSIAGFDKEVGEMFTSYNWPGNLRELRNVVRRAVLLTPAEGIVKASVLPQELKAYLFFADHQVQEPELPAIPQTGPALAGANSADPLKGAASRAEFDTIMAALKQVNFNKKKAAELLNVDRKTLYNKLKNFQQYFPS